MCNIQPSDAATSTTTRCPFDFFFIHCDYRKYRDRTYHEGLREMFRGAARKHMEEVQDPNIWREVWQPLGVPEWRDCYGCHINGEDFREVLPFNQFIRERAYGYGSIKYLAYFGHAGPLRSRPDADRQYWGGLFIGSGPRENTNLTNRPGNHPNDIPLAGRPGLANSAFPAELFANDARIFIFGCAGAYIPDGQDGSKSIANQLRDYLHASGQTNAQVFGFTNYSIFTEEPTLGHLRRPVVTGVDRSEDPERPRPDVLTNHDGFWLVPNDLGRRDQRRRSESQQGTYEPTQQDLDQLHFRDNPLRRWTRSQLERRRGATLYNFARVG